MITFQNKLQNIMCKMFLDKKKPTTAKQKSKHRKPCHSRELNNGPCHSRELNNGPCHSRELNNGSTAPLSGVLPLGHRDN